MFLHSPSWHAGCSEHGTNNEGESAMKFNRALPWVAAACLAAGTASLQAAETSKFDQLDQNHDGLVSRDEVRHLKDFTRAFDDADVNKDGKLDRSGFVNAEA